MTGDAYGTVIGHAFVHKTCSDRATSISSTISAKRRRVSGDLLVDDTDKPGTIDQNVELGLNPNAISLTSTYNEERSLESLMRKRDELRIEAARVEELIS